MCLYTVGIQIQNIQILEAFKIRKNCYPDFKWKNKMAAKHSKSGTFPNQTAVDHSNTGPHCDFFRVSWTLFSFLVSAFVLPIVQALRSRVVPRVRALIILPVQELAAQVFKVFLNYCEGSNLKVRLVSGQKSFSHEQTELVRKGSVGTYHSMADILVNRVIIFVVNICYNNYFFTTVKF